MATEISGFDAFSFPSSPEQLAVFSPPTSEYDYEYEENEVPRFKANQSEINSGFQMNRGLKRKESGHFVPVMEPAKKKQAAQSSFQSNAGIPITLVPSRVKSTTPDLSLLWSLFSVLEEESYGSPASSSPYSSPSSSYASSPASEPISARNESPAPQVYSPPPSVPDCDEQIQPQIRSQIPNQPVFQFNLIPQSQHFYLGPASEIPLNQESLQYLQWLAPPQNYCEGPEQVVLLSSFADNLN